MRTRFAATAIALITFAAIAAMPTFTSLHAQEEATPPGLVTSACHVSPIVNDLDKTARFYRDVLGLDLMPPPPSGPLPVDTDPGHLTLHGLPGSRLRFIQARMPGVRCGIEMVEFTGVDRTPRQLRMQDPGNAMLILLVRDLDAVFAKLKAAGTPIVTTGGQPVAPSKTNRTRGLVVKDPDGHFIELAQLDPLPATTVPASSNVIGIRLRVTVADMDRTVKYYGSLGIHPDVRPFEKNATVMAMMGLPDAEYRVAMAPLPASLAPGQASQSSVMLEFITFKGLQGTPLKARVQDPGAYRFQLNVKDIDAAVGVMRAAGSSLITSGNAPTTMAFGGRPWRLAIAPDVNNLFLIVQQGPPAAASTAQAPATQAPATQAPTTPAAPGGRGGRGPAAGQQVEAARMLKPGLFMITGGGANTLVRIAGDGLIVADTKNPGDEIASALMTQIASVSKLPVKFVINTQHHPDHVGNNQKFIDAGAQVIALEALKSFMASDPRTTQIPGRPTLTFVKDYTLRYGGVDVQLHHYGKGHTGDDTMVLFPDLKVVMVSDQITDATPIVDWANGGSAVEWPHVLEEVLKLDFDTAIPGRGEPRSKAAIAADKVKWDTLLDRARAAIKGGATKETLMAQVKFDDLGWMLNQAFFGNLFDELSRQK